MESSENSNNQQIDFDEPIGQQDSQAKQSQLPSIQTKSLDAETRRKAKAAYGKVFNEIRSINTDKNDKNIVKKLKSCLQEEDNCLSKFGINELLSMDAKNMAAVSEQTINVVKKITVVKKFNKHDYRRSLRLRLLRNCQTISNSIDPTKQLQLVHLYPTGKQFNHIHHLTPAIIPSFSNDFDDENLTTNVKQRNTQTRHKLPTGEATQPEQKQSNEMNNVDKSDKRLKHIYKSLKKLERKNENGVPFFQALLHPNDFATTIENIFNLAFLARQSRAIIDNQDDNGGGGGGGGFEPLIITKERSSTDDDNGDDENFIDDHDTYQQQQQQSSTEMMKIPNDKEPIQSALSFDMETYNYLLNSLSIIRPAIKDK